MSSKKPAESAPERSEYSEGSIYSFANYLWDLADERGKDASLWDQNFDYRHPKIFMETEEGQAYKIIAPGRNGASLYAVFGGRNVKQAPAEDHFEWQAKGYCIGIMHKNAQGQRIFIPRKQGSSLRQFTEAVFDLCEDEGSLEIRDGAVEIIRGNARTQIIAVGVERTIADLVEPPAVFIVPPKGKAARRFVTAINKDDSFGKERWRSEILTEMKKIFPGGYESIPLDERLVLFFPGMGKEARMWLDYGFRQRELFMIERDKKVAAKLRTMFPNAYIFNTDFGKDRRTTNGMIDDIREQICVAGDPNDVPKDFFSVVNLDPEGNMTPAFLESVGLLIENVPLADNCFLGMNFTAKREKDLQMTLYEKIWASKNPRELFPIYPEDLRKKASQHALHYLLKNATPSFRHRTLKSGVYEGESSSSKMYYSMHHLVSSHAQT